MEISCLVGGQLDVGRKVRGFQFLQAALQELFKILKYLQKLIVIK